MKNLVIVESPAKARTLTKFLGTDFKVLASFGHVRDLPKSKLGFDPENNFLPEYKVTRDKHKVVKELKRYIKKDTVIWLAADDDREGEAIAWHLIPTLGIEKHTVKRVVFHEVTKKAILHAMENPRTVDTNLVDAQQARRVLDRAVGYKLSPLLWTKIKYGLSAGRVQSVALRIVVDKEKEIMAFDPKEFWKIKLDILSNPNFKAELSKIDGKVTKVENKESADVIKRDCDSASYTLESIQEKDSTRNPPAPFTTSTIQQEASRKLGFGVKQTMTVAQKLYEGSISVPNHSGGLITYMRTDSLNLSKEAIAACNEVIKQEYGSEYNIDSPRVYKSKAKGAQEAHEAIRPVNMHIKPSDLRTYLDVRELKLYTLIWQRTMATQMAQAKVANTTYKISGGSKKQYEFVAKGTKILFPGFMKAYTEGTDDPDAAADKAEKFLPSVPQGTVFDKTNLTTEQNFTKPPARYTEASLVKKLEAEGVGRPSTYASTIATIITREYIEKNKEKKLQPTIIGTVVSDYLVENFPSIVDLKFTADIESEFDKIAEGKVKWETIMHNFYDGFVKAVKSKEGGERVQYSESRVIGKDDETGLDITVRSGQYGNYIQVGEADKEKGVKPHKISTVPKGIRPDEVTLEMAERYLTVPRIMGTTPNGDSIKVSIGKFGPFLQVKKNYYSIKPNEEYDVYTITLPIALDLIKTMDEERAKNTWLNFEEEDIKVIVGRYGPYIKGGKVNYKLPKGMAEAEVKKLTLEEIKEIMSKQNPQGKKYKMGISMHKQKMSKAQRGE